MPAELNLPVPDTTMDRWRSVLDATTVVVGASAGNLTRVSGADLEVLLVTGPDRQSYHPGERIRVDAAALNSVRFSKMLMLSDAANDIGWRRTPDGARRMTSYIGLPLRWPTGHAFGTIDFHYREPKALDQASERFFSLIRDIVEDGLARIFADSRRMEIERRRHIEMDRMSLAAAAGRGGVWDFDLNTGALHCDDRWYEIMGLDPSRPISTIDEFKRYIHPDDVEAATEIDHTRIAELFLMGQQYTNFFRIIRPTGDMRWVTSAARLIGPGLAKPDRAVGVLSDITEQHLAQQQVLEGAASLERMVESLEHAKSSAVASEQAKSALIATVSHDIRTPLTGIVGVLQRLQHEALSNEANELVRDALNCSDMLSHLLDDVLDLSRLEAGKLELRPEPVNVDEIINGTVRLMTPEAQRKSIYLTAEAHVGWVMADPVRLKQCLFNLIGNAVKFTKDGGVSIRANALRPGRVRIEVTDTGVGIPVEAQPRLFQRFEQASGTERVFGGFGLGLSIARKLAQHMGGDIGFTSRENAGSTFWLEMDAAETNAPVQDEAEIGGERSLEGVRILVVDDNPRNHQICAYILGMLGAVSVAAGSGPDALIMMQQERFDAVLMDINMPGMDGVETTRQVRALADRAAAGTPVIALTASAMAHQRQGYMEAGLDGFVAKPFHPASLLRAIQAAMANSNRR